MHLRLHNHWFQLLPSFFWCLLVSCCSMCSMLLKSDACCCNVCVQCCWNLMLVVATWVCVVLLKCYLYVWCCWNLLLQRGCGVAEIWCLWLYPGCVWCCWSATCVGVVWLQHVCVWCYWNMMPVAATYVCGVAEIWCLLLQCVFGVAKIWCPLLQCVCVVMLLNVMHVAAACVYGVVLLKFDACCCNVCVCGVAKMWCLLLQRVCVVLLKCKACCCNVCVCVLLLKCDARCCNVCVLLLKCDVCCCNVCMVSLKREACCCNVCVCVVLQYYFHKVSQLKQKEEKLRSETSAQKAKAEQLKKSTHLSLSDCTSVAHLLPCTHALLVLACNMHECSEQLKKSTHLLHLTLTAPLSPYIVHSRTTQSSWRKVPTCHTCCCLIVSLSPYSPWYNCTGWLGIKHWLTYCHLISYHAHTAPLGAVEHACSEQLKRSTHLSQTVAVWLCLCHLIRPDITVPADWA